MLQGKERRPFQLERRLRTYLSSFDQIFLFFPKTRAFTHLGKVIVSSTASI